VKAIYARIRDYLALVGISGFIIALDQWTKYLVRASLELGESWIPIEGLGGYLRVVHWHNTGAAFGIFPQAGTVITCIAVVVAVVIIIYWPRVPSNQRALRLALAMQLGGAVGNLISRITQGVVTDFIAVGNFPVFNVADSSISIGVAILIIATWIEERRTRKEPVEAAERSEPDEHAPEVDPSV
jgi:signal peptidase II